MYFDHLTTCNPIQDMYMSIFILNATYQCSIKPEKLNKLENLYVNWSMQQVEIQIWCQMKEFREGIGDTSFLRTMFPLHQCAYEDFSNLSFD